MAKKKEELMSDIGLEMQETIEKTKTMKGHAAAREKLEEMEQAISMIKQAYFRGVKTAEDMTASNEEFDASEEEKSKADKVINKLRVGWNSERSGVRRDRAIDKIHAAAEENERNTAPMRFSTNSPELQDFSTDGTSSVRNFY
jgi:hypothetical protein